MTLSPFANPAFDSPQPVAWLACAADGSESSAVYALREQADAAARDWGWMVTPLYATPQPPATPGEGSVHGWCTLTAEEREAIQWFSEYGDLQAEARRAEVLKGLLERSA